VPRIHGQQQVGWWDGHAAPTTGPTGTSTTWVGLVVRFPAAGRVFGLQFYGGTDAGAGNYTLGFICPQGIGYPDKLAIHGYTSPSDATARFQHLWLPRAFRVGTTEDYRMAVLYRGGGFFRTNNVLTTPVTRNGVTLVNGFQSTALDVISASVTVNANANAIDVLFQPD
jgi:hypothetical protein